MDERNYIKGNENPSKGKVCLVGGGPGDPGLLTLRGLECLRKADVVVHDRLSNNQLLDYAPQAEQIDVGKSSNHHPIPQSQINRILIEKASEGNTVVRLKGGDPFVFGRGGEEALALFEAGIPFEIVPGVTSAVAVPAYAGIPVTHRGVATSVAFITGHCAGSSPLNLNWQSLAQGIDTLVFLMGVRSLPMIVSSLIEAGRPCNTPIALIEKGTLPEQRVIIGTLETVLDGADEIQPPSIIIVGEVVNLHAILKWFEPETELTAR